MKGFGQKVIIGMKKFKSTNDSANGWRKNEPSTVDRQLWTVDRPLSIAIPFQKDSHW